MCPKGAQVELQREYCVRKVRKLSSEVSECKPLKMGTPLWWAAIAVRGGRAGGLELAKLLLEKGADADAIGIDTDGDKCTPLWWAARAVYYGSAGRGLHSSTFQLILSNLYGMGGARRGCVAQVKGMSGGAEGV